MTTTRVPSVKNQLHAVTMCLSRHRRGMLFGLLTGLALAALSACGGSSGAALQPVTVEPVTAQPGEADAEPTQVEPTETQQQRDEVGVFESLNFLAFAARAMNTEITDIVPREEYEISGTSCRAKSFDYKVREMDGGGLHFAVTPDGERIVGSEEGAIQAVWSACYNSQGIEITSDQLVQLVLNFGEIRFPRAEDEPTILALERRDVPYEPANLQRSGDDFTFSVLVSAQEFGDVYRVHIERAGEDFTVEYEQLVRG